MSVTLTTMDACAACIDFPLGAAANADRTSAADPALPSEPKHDDDSSFRVFAELAEPELLSLAATPPPQPGDDASAAPSSAPPSSPYERASCVARTTYSYVAPPTARTVFTTAYPV